MRIGQFEEYKGYIGSIEYDPYDKVHHGHLLNIPDLVTYQALNVEELYEKYHEAADDYIEFKRTVGKDDLVCVTK